MKETKGGLFTPEERLNDVDAFVQVDQKPIDLDFWQEAFLMDKGKYSITLKSRRTGFSFIVGLKGLVKAMDPARHKYVRQFVSYNEDNAKEKITYVKEFYHSISKKHRKELVSETKTTMEFLDYGGKTTSRLISIACRPPRGRGGDMVFDAMAIYPQNKARVIYTAGLPVIARGGCER
jgi:phage FluMu gp28-like protein